MLQRPVHPPVRIRFARLILAAGLVSAHAASAPKVLHFGNGVEPQEIDPHIVNGTYENRIIRALIEGLVSADDKLNIVPGVAKTWDISPDRLVYTFHLRPDAKWSNGTALTSRDFVRSYERVLTPAFGSPNADRLYYVVGAEDHHRGKTADFSKVGFKAVDAHTLQITLRHPTPFLLNLIRYMEWMPVPLDVIAKFGATDRPGNRWTRPENFVGNGPFVLKSWRAAQRLVVTRSPTYWDRARVKLDEIHFYPIDNPDVEERMFRTGQLHVTNVLPVSKIASYQRAQSPALHIDPWAGLYAYVFNIKQPPFTDVRVRRAFAMAIDRESIVKNVTRAAEQPAYFSVPPGVVNYPNPPGFKADLASARRLLADAGFPGGKGLPPIELFYNTSENHRAIAEAIQQMWRKNLGVEVTLANQEWKVYIDALKKTRTFQVARAGWISGEAHLHLYRWETGHSNNDAQWSNSTYDRLLRESLAAPTTNARIAIYQEMEKILIDEMPMMPIYFTTLPRLISPKVIGFRTTLDDSYPWQDADLAP
jgi:oligopeptide transport system substrate-binding protein